MKRTPLPMTPLESLASSAVSARRQRRRQQRHGGAWPSPAAAARAACRPDLHARTPPPAAPPAHPAAHRHLFPCRPRPTIFASQVRTAHKVQASLVVVLTRGGATARLVAKYRPTGEAAPPV